MSGLFSQVGMAVEARTSKTIAASGSTVTAGVPNIATLTTTVAHTFAVGDVVTITSGTPATINGQWTITAVPSTTTFVIQTGSTLLTAATAGTANCTAYGLTTTPARFFEATSESVEIKNERLNSKSLAIGQRTQSATRFLPYEKGAAGDLELEAMTKGFGFFLAGMVGPVTTTANAPVSGAHTHVANLGNVRGTSYTYQ